MSVRELPWSGAEGKRSYVIGDGDGDGPVSRLADEREAALLGLARHVLGRAERTLAGSRAADTELLGLVAHLTDALGDALRIIEGD
ncbi:hypothetical protein [Streptomyces sp. CB03238]|uniref:hypothetical protein n=1 Tax=Streptomyces sp. CB03238 TaxID=1907777 RepID=UPI000A0F5596|nr:hypothetical protein [Streptomyces sp. CB03238]ORT58491.1 hypothetical protein BKD26_17980 [Streptomyces sp. CB03238]